MEPHEERHDPFGAQERRHGFRGFAREIRVVAAAEERARITIRRNRVPRAGPRYIAQKNRKEHRAPPLRDVKRTRFRILDAARERYVRGEMIEIVRRRSEEIAPRDGAPGA